MNKDKEIIINLELAKKQNLKKKDIIKLIDTYKDLYQTIDLANKNKKLKKPGSGIEIALKIEQLEYKLQELWKFSKDSSKHKYWNRLSNCICPKKDNVNSLNRIINNNCIFHGKKIELENSPNL